MSEDEKDADLKDLLRTAEKQIEELHAQVIAQAENNALLMDAQRAEAEQMVQLTEQIWSLEEALASTNAEKDEILARLSQLRSTVEILQRDINNTLEAATKNASQLELAARVYEMSSLTEEDDDEPDYRQQSSTFFKELQSKLKM